MYYLGCITTTTTVTNKGMRCSYTIYVDAKCIKNLYPRRFDALDCKIRKGLTERISPLTKYISNIASSASITMYLVNVIEIFLYQ